MMRGTFGAPGSSLHQMNLKIKHEILFIVFSSILAVFLFLTCKGESIEGAEMGWLSSY